MSSVARAKAVDCEGFKSRRLPWSEVHVPLGTLRTVLHVMPVTIAVHDRRLALAERYKLSNLHAMIVAAALFAGCDRLWSEDMQDGLIVEKQRRIMNLFGPPAS